MADKLKVTFEAVDKGVTNKLDHIGKLAKENSAVFPKMGTAISGASVALGSMAGTAGQGVSELITMGEILFQGGPVMLGIAALGTGLAAIGAAAFNASGNVKEFYDAFDRDTASMVDKIDSLNAKIAGKDEPDSGVVAAKKHVAELEEQFRKLDQTMLDNTNSFGVYVKNLVSGDSFGSLEARLKALIQQMKLARVVVKKAEQAANADKGREAAAAAKAAADKREKEEEARRKRRIAAQKKEDDADRARMDRDAKVRASALAWLDKQREDAHKKEVARQEKLMDANILEDEQLKKNYDAERQRELDLFELKSSHMEEMQRMREEEAQRNAEMFAQEMINISLFAGAQFAQYVGLQAQMAAARQNNNGAMVEELKRREQELAVSAAASAAEYISQLAIEHGSVLVLRGASEAALGNPGAPAAIAGGAALIALGIGGMAGASAIRGFAAGSIAPQGGTADTFDRPTFTSSPTSSTAAGDVKQQTTVININGPAFGLTRDRTDRFLYSRVQVGRRLEGLMP